MVSVHPSIELKSENGKVFVQGYVSTTEADKYRDVVTATAQQKIYSQLQGSIITMDLDHEEWREKDGKPVTRKLNKIPVAKVVEAKLDDKGTFVKAELNQDHPNFTSIYNSVKNKFLYAFSIAYNVLKAKTQEYQGLAYRVIDDLNIFNIGMTGNPVNDSARFEVALKSFSKMENETNTEANEVKVENVEQVEQVETKEVVETPEVEAAELKSEETKTSEVDYQAMYAELKSFVQEDIKSYVESLNAEKSAELKSEPVEDSNKEILELKSKIVELEKQLNEPVFKGNSNPNYTEMKSQEAPKQFDAMSIINEFYK